MKREEELNDAWCKYRGKCTTDDLQALRFALLWCDENTNWISVEDELPPLIDKNNPYDESVQVLFVVVLDGVQYINKGSFDYDTGVWHSLDMQCSFCKDNITHWMPMPALPKKGGEQ